MKSLFYLFHSSSLFWFAGHVSTFTNLEIGTTMICKADYIKNNVTIDSLLFRKWYRILPSFNKRTEAENHTQLTTIQHFNNFKVLYGQDSIFTAHLALDAMSTIINDLVLYQTEKDGKLYLEDGYPVNSNSPELLTIRAQNSAKRAVNWQNSSTDWTIWTNCETEGYSFLPLQHHLFIFEPQRYPPKPPSVRITDDGNKECNRISANSCSPLHGLLLVG